MSSAEHDASNALCVGAERINYTSKRVLHSRPDIRSCGLLCSSENSIVFIEHDRVSVGAANIHANAQIESHRTKSSIGT
jgi:hypothetical protein